MKLTATQIERLYEFTRQHYVEFYDLQTELVDHLANAIEQQWQENPKLVFEDALQVEFKKFGVFGFMDVLEKRQAAMNKKYNKMVLNNLKTFFSVPKIIGTLLSVELVYLLIKSLQHYFMIVQIIFFLIIFIFVVGIQMQSRKYKKHVKKTGKKWMLQNIIFGYSSVLAFIQIPVQFAIYLKSDNYSNWVLMLFSFFIVLLGLLSYIILILIPSKAENYLKQTYPEYEIAK